MKMAFTGRERSALYRLLSDVTSDIILKTDRNGFIVQASRGMESLGISLPNMLIGPHVQDLADAGCAAMIEARHADAIGGRGSPGWIEFRARSKDRRERWFEIQMRGLIDAAGHAYGALCIMRSIDERRAFEEQLFAAAMTDPLTGLTNRRAFLAMLGHMVDGEGHGEGCLALFALDGLKRINRQHGQAAGDAALVAFAEALRDLFRGQDILSRVGGESLGVLLPGVDAEEAEALCRRVIAALAQRREVAGAGPVALTASAGVAGIRGSVDETLKRAETALFLAKAKGRNRLEVDGKAHFGWHPEARAS
jgi:diguanylate cyclase (GGDEF)-like protein/PAS domain S-box-containing protein